MNGSSGYCFSSSASPKWKSNANQGQYLCMRFFNCFDHIGRDFEPR
jgi:hypothetical protein